MTEEYRVPVSMVCGGCDESGVVVNPAWTLFWDAHPTADGKVTHEEVVDWFHSGGYEGVPPEEVDCVECRGTGYQERLVTLPEFKRMLAEAE